MSVNYSQVGSAPGSTSSGLLERARLRDPEAWRALTRLYGPLVYQWARRAQLQPSDASDVTQEVFQSVAQRLATFRHDQPSDTFRGWLWTITRNKVRDVFRDLASRPQATGGSEAYQQLQQAPDSPAAGGSTPDDAAVRQALEQLRTDFEPETLEMIARLLGGATPAEVAAERQLSVWAVYKARARVLKRVRELLGDRPAS